MLIGFTLLFIKYENVGKKIKTSWPFWTYFCRELGFVQTTLHFWKCKPSSMWHQVDRIPSSYSSFSPHQTLWPQLQRGLAHLYRFSLVKSNGPCWLKGILPTCRLIRRGLPLLFSHLSNTDTFSLFDQQRSHLLL